MSDRTSNFPRRNRQHELETASRRHFENLLPDSWILNSAHIDPEYGLDGTIEVFKDGRDRVPFLDPLGAEIGEILAQGN